MEPKAPSPASDQQPDPVDSAPAAPPAVPMGDPSLEPAVPSFTSPVMPPASVVGPPATAYIVTLWAVVIAAAVILSMGIMSFMTYLSFFALYPKYPGGLTGLFDIEFLATHLISAGLFGYGVYRLRQLSHDTSGFIGFNRSLYTGIAAAAVLLAAYIGITTFVTRYIASADTAYQTYVSRSDTDSADTSTPSSIANTSDDTDTQAERDEIADEDMASDLLFATDEVGYYYEDEGRLPATVSELNLGILGENVTYAVNPEKSTDQNKAAKTFQVCGVFKKDTLATENAMPLGGTPVAYSKIDSTFFDKHSKGKYCYNVMYDSESL